MSDYKIQWSDYYDLTKPKVVMLLVFTAVIGMFLAVPPMGSLPWLTMLYASIGIGLASASAAAINQVVDQRADEIMARTKNRPLPQGKMPIRNAMMFALIIGVVGLGLLWWQVNFLTAALTFASLIGYAVIYTMYLKRATPQNIVIGGAAGAAPPVLGWTSITNSVDPNSLLLFLIIFVWTPPHFWALAIHRKDEYAKVEIPMLPVTHGIAFTRYHVLLYTILLLVVSVLPFATRMSGVFYLGGALALGMGFLYYAIMLMKSEDSKLAMKTFGYSIMYLMGIFAFLLVDHYIPLIQSLFN